jgi:16S rRNA (cytosine1402-N4)-methyltransferase
MHKSVLLNESIENLNIRENLIYVDCTLGYAGHSKEILKKIKKGWLYAFDQDEEAIEFSEKELKKIGNNFEIINTNFVNLKKELNKRNITKVDGILFDLGVSSPQLDNKDRGFSYHEDAKLDMRMNQKDGISAHDIINNYPYEKLVDIFFTYGEEKYSKNIAKKICEYRKSKSIDTTLELVEVIKSAVPERYKRETHPGRRVFQAVRIEVNNELEVLESALEQAIELLNKDGRICVITFHSLEDRICKKIFKKYSDVNPIVKNLPIIPDEYKPTLKIIGKYEPSKQELEENNRARSATLRVAEKI